MAVNDGKMNMDEIQKLYSHINAVKEGILSQQIENGH
jgi:hypothetical protein